MNNSLENKININMRHFDPSAKNRPMLFKKFVGNRKYWNEFFLLIHAQNKQYSYTLVYSTLTKQLFVQRRVLTIICVLLK